LDRYAGRNANFVLGASDRITVLAARSAAGDTGNQPRALPDIKGRARQSPWLVFRTSGRHLRPQANNSATTDPGVAPHHLMDWGGGSSPSRAPTHQDGHKKLSAARGRLGSAEWGPCLVDSAAFLLRYPAYGPLSRHRRCRLHRLPSF
jgi:hypothetical protein